MEPNYIKVMQLSDLTSLGACLGARAFYKLGRDDDAEEICRLAIAPERNTLKRTSLVACHSILGQVAAKRGQVDEADVHMSNALNEARISRLPMLEVLAARDWKRFVLEPAGRDCGPADEVIGMVATKMNKTRAQLEPVLSAT